jgi:hypothetical protein
MAFVKVHKYPKRQKRVSLPLKELIDEHAHLIDVLKSDGERGLEEAKDQAKELKEYRRKAKRG